MNVLLDIARLMRPRFWVIVVAPLLAGEVLSNGAFPALPVFLISALSLIAFYVAIFIVNQMHDRDADIEGKKGLPLAEGTMSLRQYAFIFFVVFGLGIVLSLFVGIPFMLACMLFFSSGIVYTYALKKRPISDLITNGIMEGSLPFLAGWIVFNRVNGLCFLLIAVYCLLVGSGYVLQSIPDARADRKYGVITTVVRFGPDRSAWIGFIFYLIGFCLWLVILLRGYLPLDSLWAVPFGILAAFFYLRFVLRSSAAIANQTLDAIMLIWLPANIAMVSPFIIRA